MNRRPQMAASDYAALALERGRCVAGDPALRVHRDIAYGPAPAQRLDVFVPAAGDEAGGALPVLLFLHGGGFTQGSRAWNAFMAPLLASVPAVLVSADYRLIPEVAWPVPLDDCRRALAWVVGEIAAYGGDPRRVFVGGHSAGAALATLLALDAPPDSPPDAMPDMPPLAGVVNVSGSFNRLAITGTPGSEPGWPPGPMPIEANAPLSRSIGDAVCAAWLMIWGDRETQRERVERSSLALMGRLVEQGRAVEHLVVRDADHFDAHLAFADRLGAPSRRLVAWMREHAQRPKPAPAAADVQAGGSPVGMWRALQYRVGDRHFALTGLLALSDAYLVAAIAFDSETAGHWRINANAGPYRLGAGCIEMIQWIQLHLDQALPFDTLVTEGLPEAIDYVIDGDRLELVFPSGNRMRLVRCDTAPDS